jgi:flagellar hook-associated protein 2
MATIGSLGIGSGLDLNGLMDKLEASERAPLAAIKARQSGYNARLSAYGTLKSLLGTLQAAADKLADASFMTGFKTTSSAATVLTTSGDSTAVAGSYSVNVARLAQSQSLVSGGVATSTADVGSAAATLTIDFGAISGTLNETSGAYDAGASFDADGTRTAVSVALEAGKTSLADVRDAINKAAGGTVTATIVHDGSNNRLVLASSATGLKSSMRVAVGGTNAELNALLGNDPAGVQALRQTVAAQDAALTVNGIAVTSATNTVAASIQGVTLTLAAAGSSVVKVERDTASVEGAINDLVGAYNKLNTKLKDLSAYNAEKRIGGTLLGDSAVRLIQSRLRAALTEPRAGEAGDPKLLSDIGVAFQKDGSLEVKAGKLAAVLAGNPAGVATLFAGAAGGSGLGKGVSSLVDTLNHEDNGLLAVATDGARKAISRLDREYESGEERLEAKLTIYRAQFRQLDSVMSGMTATSNYLSTQFAQLTKSK